MVSVRIPLDPTAVNVLTDVLLILLTLTWLVLLRWWTAADLKRHWRKNEPVYSYEHLGGYQYLKDTISGQKKARKLEASPKHQTERQYSWLLLKAATLLVLSVAIFGMQIFIDFGLDFETVRSPTTTIKSYNMSRFAPNNECSLISTDLRKIADKDQEFLSSYCNGRDLSTKDCANVKITMENYFNVRIREAMMLIKQLVATNSLEELDVVNKIIFSYELSSDAINEDGTTDCRLKERRGLESFKGTLDWSGSNCKGGGLTAIYLQLGLRVVPVDMQVSNDNAPVDFIERYQSEPFHYQTFESMKDRAQKKTLYNIKNGFTDEDPAPLQVGRVEANSQVRYHESEEDKVIILDLNRLKRAKGPMQNFVAYSIAELRFEEGIRVAGPDYCLREGHTPAREFDMLDMSGVKCNAMPFNLQLSPGQCTRCIRTVGTDAGSVQVMVGRQIMHGTIVYVREQAKSSLFDTEDQCLRGVGEFFREEFDEYLEKDGELAVMADMRLIVFCATELITAENGATQPNGSKPKKCIAGPGNYRFNGSEWEDVSVTEEVQSYDDACSLAGEEATAVSWSAAQLVGVESEEALQLFQNVKELSEIHYKTMRSKMSRNTSRKTISLIELKLAMQQWLSLLSTQVVRVEKQLFQAEETQLAVLNVQYIAGLSIIVGLLLMALLIVSFRQLREVRAYRKLSCEVVVPSSVTQWISAAVPFIDGSGEHPDIFHEEYTARKVDSSPGDNAASPQTWEETSTSELQFGFSTHPCPLSDFLPNHERQ